jgi:hypothetical protein
LCCVVQVPPTAALTALHRPCLPHQTQSLLPWQADLMPRQRHRGARPLPPWPHATAHAPATSGAGCSKVRQRSAK